MRNICSRCNGTGYEEYDEDHRVVRDSCYHCGESGYVDGVTHWHDQLAEVAKTLAYYQVSKLKADINSDPEGEGWDFRAAENMMTGSDYFRVRCWEYEDVIINQLMNMPDNMQKVLVAWQQFNQDEMIKFSMSQLSCPKNKDYIPYRHMDVWGIDDNEILF